MATRKGYGGNLTITGAGTPTNLRVFEWLLDETREAFDDNKFGTYTSDIEVTGGMTRRTVTLRANADKADSPTLCTLTSAISDQNDEPNAVATLYEGFKGTTGATPDAYHKLTCLVTACRVACARRGGTVDYDITLAGSGAKTVAP